MTKATFKVVNRCGIHARPAAFFAEIACSFESKIQLKANGKIIDAKSMLMIMSMGLFKGTEITLVANGPDEWEAVNTLARIVCYGFGEDVEEYCEPKITSDTVRKVSENDIPSHIRAKIGIR